MTGKKCPYVYVDGIYLRRNRGGEYENVAIPVAVAVNQDDFREVIGAAEGMKEDKSSWVNFFQWLRERGLSAISFCCFEYTNRLLSEPYGSPDLCPPPPL